jgi:hypothetical protein
VTGPAVVQLPTLSQKLCVPVEALASSRPAATVVVSVAEALVATPEPPSVAEHDDVWLSPCQAESAGVQVAEGALRSIFQPVTGPAVVQLPTLSQKLCVSVEAFASSKPATTVVFSVAEALDATPEPPSVAEHADDWLLPCHSESAGAQLNDGAFLSTLRPVIGPAVMQLSKMSHSWRVPVDALFVSVPAATFVDSENDAGESARRPFESVAVQLMSMSSLCHKPSAGAHTYVGACLSIIQPAIGPTIVQLPSVSQSCWLLVDALLVCVPPATFVASSKDAGEFASRPLVSVAVQLLD